LLLWFTQKNERPDLGVNMQNSDYQELRDERDIREVLTRYCRAIDRCDLELLKSVYWPEATDDHVIFVGNAFEFADFVIPMLKQQVECTMHMISNVWMKLDGDTACAETYVNAYHRMQSNGDKLEVVVGGRYLDRLERRHGEWRIAGRKFVVDWEQNGAALLGKEKLATLLAMDTRQRDEDSYRLFAGKALT
jgi:SnoaL-like domain